MGVTRYSDIAILLLSICLFHYFANAYDVSNHPCCTGPNQNVSLAMLIDAFEIYGHDPTDKLDHLAHYQLAMMQIKRAPDQYIINEQVHIATDHLGRFILMHIKELKVLLIALEDAIDNMLTMYDNHNAIKNERVSTFNSPLGGQVPMEFYLSQEFYCGKNVYIFISELYSDIYYMGRGREPYCKNRGFHFLGFVHFMDDNKYYLESDPSIAFATDNYAHGLECHLTVCIFRYTYMKFITEKSTGRVQDLIRGRLWLEGILGGVSGFPLKKVLQQLQDVVTMPKAIVKCGTELYKLPPLTAVSCTISSGSFIFDFNIQGIRFRHYDYVLWLPTGHYYYTKEKQSPLICDHHVCEWNNTNFYGGPFIIPGEPGAGLAPVPPYLEQTTKFDFDDGGTTPYPDWLNNNETYSMTGCWFVYPPNYGSIAGVSYLDSLTVNENRFSCSGVANRGLYWYPQWMGAPPHHPYPKSGEKPKTDAFEPIYSPHQANLRPRYNYKTNS